MIFNHSSCLRCNCKQIIFQNQFEFLQFHLQPGVEEGGGEQEHVGGEEEGKGIPERYDDANPSGPAISRPPSQRPSRSWFLPQGLGGTCSLVSARCCIPAGRPVKVFYFGSKVVQL